MPCRTLYESAFISSTLKPFLCQMWKFSKIPRNLSGALFSHTRLFSFFSWVIHIYLTSFFCYRKLILIQFLRLKNQRSKEKNFKIIKAQMETTQTISAGILQLVAILPLMVVQIFRNQSSWRRTPIGCTSHSHKLHLLSCLIL